MSIQSQDTFLARMLSHKHNEVEGKKQKLPLGEWEQLARTQPAPRDFHQALTTGESVAVIAEMKKASPSAGVLRENFDPAALAKSYATNNAAAISVLTDEKFFQGKLSYLRQAREACALPMLQKNFIVDSYQIVEARAFGADAILLIAAILEQPHLVDLLAATQEWRMQALVEVHSPEEIAHALQAGAEIIGINNRDLKTFIVSLTTTEQLARLVPHDCVCVAESGVTSRADVERLAACGVDAILVGSYLMRQKDPGETLSTLIGVPRQK